MGCRVALNSVEVSEQKLRFQRVARQSIRLGEPLPWPVYDAKGQLLLERGYVVETELQLEKLIERGMFLTEADARTLNEPEAVDEPRSADPFGDLNRWLMELQVCFRMFEEKQAGIPQRLAQLVQAMDFLCRSDADACLAMAHVHAVEPSPAQQTLFYAVLCGLMARQLNYETADRYRMLAAAITANVALMPYQERLNQSHQALTAKLREIINKHPVLSVTALRQVGITDERWLRIVAQHHEKPDGSGYPAGLTAAEILPEAAILALVERYTAMVTLRGYRSRRMSSEALRDIQHDSRDESQQALVQALSALLSPYPPGTFVRLANCETAIVIRRELAQQSIQVKAVVNPGGVPYLNPIARDCRHRDFQIVKSVEPKALPELNLTSLWDYG